MSKQVSTSIQDGIHLLAQRMVEKQIKLCAAESCTGGMLSQWLTTVEGSSKWFECGFVTYSNASKIKLLGVQSKVLDEHGAVSREVAEQMSLGALNNSKADISVSITGIAGPGGGSEVKPVGTVYIATATLNHDVHVVHYQFAGNRDEIRLQTTHSAIQQLIDCLD